MKRSGFAKLTYSEALAKKQAKTAVRKKNARKVAKCAKKLHKKPKPKRIKTLKTKLWSTFSRYIRQKYADHSGYVITCDTGERMHWTETHCGHLFANTERNQQLGGNELWYYENNFAPQSPKGNTFNVDNAGHKYMIWAIHRYGLEEVVKMRKMKETHKMWTEEELTALLEKYAESKIIT